MPNNNFLNSKSLSATFENWHNLSTTIKTHLYQYHQQKKLPKYHNRSRKPHDKREFRNVATLQRNRLVIVTVINFAMLSIRFSAGFMWNVDFKCSEAGAHAQIKTEGSCFVALDYFTREMCGVFLIKAGSSVVTAVVVSVVTLVAALMGGIYFYIWRVRNKYRMLNGDSKDNVRVYLKVTVCNFVVF